MRTTPDGKKYAQVTDMNHAGVVEVHPRVYAALSLMVNNHATGKLIFNFSQGDVANIKVGDTDIETLTGAIGRNGNGRG